MAGDERRALVVMHATTTMGRAGERLWVPVDDKLAKRAANGLLTVLEVEGEPSEADPPEGDGDEGDGEGAPVELDGVDGSVDADEPDDDG